MSDELNELQNQHAERMHELRMERHKQQHARRMEKQAQQTEQREELMRLSLLQKVMDLARLEEKEADDVKTQKPDQHKELLSAIDDIKQSLGSKAKGFKVVRDKEGRISGCRLN
jgi:hypothetical protein